MLAAGFILLAAASFLGIFLGSTPLSFEEILLGFQKGFFFAEADKFGILRLAKAFRPGKKPEGFHKIGLALGVFAGDYIDLFARRH